MGVVWAWPNRCTINNKQLLYQLSVITISVCVSLVTYLQYVAHCGHYVHNDHNGLYLNKEMILLPTLSLQWCVCLVWSTLGSTQTLITKKICVCN